MNADHPAANPLSPTDANVPPVRLGPLVRVDGGWFIGDHRSKAYLAVLPGGFEHRVTDREPFLVPWHRLMGLGLGVTSGRFLSTPVGGLLTKYDDITIHGSCLNAMVRHPYDMWKPRFIHHRHRYPALEIMVLRQLLGDIVELGHAERLGDDAWLTSAVHRLAPKRFLRRGWSRKAIDAGMKEIITDGL
ncbi:hypothetical protein ACWEQL_33190 [Kitasatospora sp. NPDC004240]